MPTVYVQVPALALTKLLEWVNFQTKANNAWIPPSYQAAIDELRTVLFPKDPSPPDAR